MSGSSAQRRLARIESALVPAASPVFSDSDLIAALGTRSAGPAEVHALFEIVQKAMACSIMTLAIDSRLERDKPTQRDRIACGPIELVVEAVSYRLDETPPRLHRFYQYAPELWSTRKNQAGVFYALWVHSHLLELLLGGDAEAKALRRALDCREAGGAMPDVLDDDHVYAVCDPRLGPLLAPIAREMPMMMDYPVVHRVVLSHCRRLVAEAAAEEADAEPAEEEASAEPEDPNDDSVGPG